MQFTRKLFVLVAALILVASSVFAQYPPCHIPPGVYCTRTQGGWGAECNGGNAGCILQNNFATVFPAGLTIGGTFTIHFSSNIAVRDFLPAGETPGVLTANHTDPASTEAGVFAGQLTALAINVAMGDAGVAGFTDIGHLIIPQGIDFPAGPFAGYSVDQILALANQVLGGDLGALPAGISVSELSSVLNAINNNFDNCTDSDEYLVEPGCDEILPVAMGTFYAEPSADGIGLAYAFRTEC